MTTTVATLERQTQGEFGGPDPAARRSNLPHLLAIVAAHAVATLLLIWPAFWNGFPLVFADTGTYLGQALMRYLGWDRPPFYSFFLLATDWGETLWLPIIVQGLLTAHLVGLVLRVLNRPEPVALPITAAALAILTPLPWFVAQLMPDLFTGITVLTVWLLGFRRAMLSRPERIYVFCLATLAVVVHQSHVPLGLGLVVVGGLLLAITRGWRQALRPTLRMAFPVLLAALTLVTMNSALRGRPSLSPYGVVFVATRLLYDGPALDVVRRDCPEVGWKLCGAVGRMPDWHNGFLWNRDSPLYHELGSPAAWAPEANAIVLATLRAEPLAVLRTALGNTLEQLTLFGVGDGLEPWPASEGPVPIVARFFPQELAALEQSRQQTGRLLPEARRFIPLHLAVMLAGLGCLLWLLTWGRHRLQLHTLALILLVLAGTLGNAAITGALSGPAGRYQGRIVWVLPFAAAMVLSGLRLVPQAAPTPFRPRFPG